MSGTYHASSDSSGPQQETDAADHPADHLDAPEGLRGEVAHLQEAVKSQRDIGMAIGLLSARFGCSTEQAWRTMQRVSQNSNVKVRTVAHVLVTTHDGSAKAEALDLLETLASQLPPSGWPSGPWTGNDHAP